MSRPIPLLARNSTGDFSVEVDRSDVAGHAVVLVERTCFGRTALCMTPEEARAIAHYLTRAAEEAEPELELIANGE